MAAGEQHRVQLSFDEYVRGRGSALIRFAYLLVGDWALAEDLAQEALISAHAKWRRVQDMDHPDAYVRKAVLRRWLSWRRLKSSGERPAGLDLTVIAPSVTDPSAAVVDRDAIWALLQTLPRRQRAVLVLRFYEDLPDDEIARVL